MQYLLNLRLSNDDLTKEHMLDILETVHSPGASEYLGTVYTNIFDLTTRDIYHYILGNYEEVFTLNLQDELEKGEHELRITLNGDFTSKSTIGFETVMCILSLILIVRFTRPKTK